MGMIDTLVESAHEPYFTRVQNGLSKLFSYARSFALTRAEKAEHPPAKPERISLDAKAILDPKELRYWSIRPYIGRRDSSPTVMTLSQLRRIVGDDVADLVEKAYENGEVDRLSTHADWDDYSVFLSFPTEHDGIKPAPGVRLLHATERRRI